MNHFFWDIAVVIVVVGSYFPVKYEPTRFLGEGVSFKAKLIGILEVSEASGDRMCQAALADLKMAIRAAGEHKQRISIQVSIDGVRLRDEKSGVKALIAFLLKSMQFVFSFLFYVFYRLFHKMPAPQPFKRRDS